MKLRVAVAVAKYACLSRMLEPRPSRFRAATQPIPSRDRKGAVRRTRRFPHDRGSIRRPVPHADDQTAGGIRIMKLRVAVAKYACLSRILTPPPSRFPAATEPIPSRDRKGAVRLPVAAQNAAPYRMPTIKPPEESAS